MITTAVAASSPAAENKHLSGSDTKEDDAEFESLNTTQSDEDIAMACGKLEEDQVIRNYFLCIWMCLTL